MADPTHHPWKVLRSRTVLDAGPWVRVDAQDVALPERQTIPDFYRVVLRDHALVYAVTEHDEVLMLRQYKHGVGDTCLLFPGGYLQPDEPSAAAAARELLEETGYVADSWRSLGSFVVDANQRCATVHLFRADHCRYDRTPSSGDLEAMELVYVPRRHVVAPDCLREMKVVSHVALALLGAGERT